MNGGYFYSTCCIAQLQGLATDTAVCVDAASGVVCMPLTWTDRASNNLQETSVLWVTWLQNGWDDFKHDFLLPKEKWKIIWIKFICSASGEKSLHHSLSISSESRFESCKESPTSTVMAPVCSANGLIHLLLHIMLSGSWNCQRQGWEAGTQSSILRGKSQLQSKA